MNFFVKNLCLLIAAFVCEDSSRVFFWCIYSTKGCWLHNQWNSSDLLKLDILRKGFLILRVLKIEKLVCVLIHIVDVALLVLRVAFPGKFCYVCNHFSYLTVCDIELLQNMCDFLMIVLKTSTITTFWKEFSIYLSIAIHGVRLVCKVFH